MPKGVNVNSACNQPSKRFARTGTTAETQGLGPAALPNLIIADGVSHLASFLANLAKVGATGNSYSPSRTLRARS